MSSNQPGTDEKSYLFDNPQNVKRILKALYGICAILVILDFVIHRHTYLDIEKLFAFYAVYGFVGCVLLVLIAKWMRTFLMRDEDYYLKQESLAPESKKESAHVDD
ncbi:MAG: hypothetical protein OEY09_10300 [Gammaproteobacteria bacterium]|nr:hypothetical protein [Gammaproteobacteria bacterium]